MNAPYIETTTITSSSYVTNLLAQGAAVTSQMAFCFRTQRTHEPVGRRMKEEIPQISISVAFLTTRRGSYELHNCK